MITTYAELEQGSDEWLAARCGLLTASTIGRLITPSTLKTADNDTSRGLTLTLAAERITGHVEYVHPTLDMQRGTEDEPEARAVYADHNAPVQEIGFVTLEQHGYTIGYSPDGYVGDDGLIEIKSRKPDKHIAHVLAGKPPLYNMAQMQAGMYITGREWCDYVSFSGGLPLWVSRVYPEQRWYDAIDTAARAFEENVTAIVNNFTNATQGLPMTERRPELEEIRF
ncbi:YqaJ-like recombinase domain-containing protein [Agromyces sp. CF514]|uniref:lambda exonuclease family protein n=1 Tax=Agromyces sp. CF514 TaxID=1881031 RepID=UPI0008EA6F26|nr:lambda exonuclease family protein [Agromyces sp. CF514]SFR75936.1 YqaJ-like recombinase domain-containing protein [Agromyces sp. CF514]